MQSMLTANEVVAFRSIRTSKGYIEVGEESRQTEDGADDGRAVSVRERPEGCEEDHDKIVAVASGCMSGLVLLSTLVALRHYSC